MVTQLKNFIGNYAANMVFIRNSKKGIKITIST